MTRSLAVLFAAALVGVVSGFWHQSGLAGGSTSGAMAVDCDGDTPAVESECAYTLGSTFVVNIHVVEAPPQGYLGFQAKLQWDQGVVTYLPTADLADEALWADCDIPARSPEPPTGEPPQLYGCFPSLRSRSARPAR